jgi:pimeloyl-ACP methyl ester carboxylesterase
MTVVLVHGSPETGDIWRPLQDILGRKVMAIALPGFGAARPNGFAATKDTCAEWLGQTLARFEQPVDVVAHDVGALLTMRVASAFDIPLRSWTIDVANIFHPQFTLAEAPNVVAPVLEPFWSSLD